MFLCTVCRTLLYPMFILSLIIAIARLFFTTGVCGCLLVDVVASADWGFGVCIVRRLLANSSFGHICTSYMTSAGNGACVRFFRSKYEFFAFSQLRLLGELLVTKFESAFFGFLLMWTSNCEIFVTLCGVIQIVFLISATSEANLYGVWFLSNLTTPNLRFIVWIIPSTAPIDPRSSIGAKVSLMLLVFII